MMKRSNQYDIEIIFKTTGKNTLLFSSSIPYLGSALNLDSVKIYSKKITLSCKRAAVINLDEVFYNHNSSLYNQIIKCLVYYYALNFNCPKIKEINVTRKATSEILERKTLTIDSIIQPVAGKITSNIVFDHNAIEILFEENEKGKTILIALSYWLKAMSTNDSVFTFERLWRGLNGIYSLVGAHGNETQCHIALRALLIGNSHILTNSSAEVNGYTSQYLRNSFRWRAMILNDYSTINKTERFRDFVLRYSDERIIRMFDETLPYRQDFLNRQGFLPAVTGHIAAQLATPVKSNTELVAILCIKYSYFIRNKSFHGEKIDGTFRLVENKEIRELEKINKLQSFFVADLINSNHIY